MRTLFSGLGSGFRLSFRNLRITLVLWLLNFVTALLILGPLLVTLQKDLGHSVRGAELWKTFSVAYIGEFASSRPDIMGMTFFLLSVGAGVLLFLQIFVSGGVLGLFADHAKGKNTSRFLQHGARWFFRFFRLAIIYIIVLVGIVILYQMFAAKPLNQWLNQQLDETVVAAVTWTKAGLFLAFLGFLRLWFDYARIRLVTDASGSTIRATWWGLRFVLRNIVTLSFLSLFLGLFTAGIWWGYIFVQGQIKVTDLNTIGLLFLASQAFLILRVWMRMMYFGSHWGVVQQLASEQVLPSKERPRLDADSTGFLEHSGESAIANASAAQAAPQTAAQPAPQVPPKQPPLPAVPQPPASAPVQQAPVPQSPVPNLGPATPSIGSQQEQATIAQGTPGIPGLQDVNAPAPMSRAPRMTPRQRQAREMANPTPIQPVHRPPSYRTLPAVSRVGSRTMNLQKIPMPPLPERRDKDGEELLASQPSRFSRVTGSYNSYEHIESRTNMTPPQPTPQPNNPHTMERPPQPPQPPTNDPNKPKQ